MPDFISCTRLYDDSALPIGYEQTISQPYTVAFMCQEARLTADDTVLEIGTGTGYGAAVLAELQAVHTVERIESLYRAAAERLARLRFENVRVYFDDGSLGLIRKSRSTRSSCTAGAEELPAAYQDQLTDGGRLVIPIGPPGHQQMFRFTRRGDDGTPTPRQLRLRPASVHARLDSIAALSSPVVAHREPCSKRKITITITNSLSPGG